MSLSRKWQNSLHIERAEAAERAVDNSKVSVGVFPGGGKLGLISVLLAERFEEISGKAFHESFDRLHGTSVGAINAAMLWPLAKTGQPAHSPTTLKDGYYDEMDDLFAINHFSVGGLFGSKYKGGNIEGLLEKTFGDIKLSDFADGLYIHVVDFDTKEEISLSSTDAKTDPTKDFYIKDLLRAATAFPMGYDQVTIHDMEGNERRFTDGGVFAPDPSFVVYQRTKADVPRENIVLTSFGTGKEDHDLTLEDLNGGAVLSGLSTLKAVFMAAAKTNETLLRNAMGDRYTTLDHDITGTDLDMVSDMKDIRPVAEEAADANEEEIRKALTEIHKIHPVQEITQIDSHRRVLQELAQRNGANFIQPDGLRLQ